MDMKQTTNASTAALTPSTPYLTLVNGKSPAEREALVMEARPRAYRAARRMLLGVSRYMSPAEIQSIADFALWEAALRYDDSRGARFFTYSFFFIKGEIRRALKLESDARRELDGNDASAGFADEYESASPLERLQCEAPQPDQVVELNRVRAVAFEAPAILTAMEQQILRGVYVCDKSVDEIAVHLGYSRGHAYAMRKTAERKVRNYLHARDRRELHAA
jgi:RNA polymerase sigma factor (sigma-70 family)